MTSAADLEHRIKRLEDRAAIQDLGIRYCVAIDAGDYDELAELYTEKATLGAVVGRHEVVDTLKSIRATYGRTIHTPEAHTVTFVDDDHATGLVLSHAELDIAGITIHTAIRYRDDYERGEDGAWRFANRALTFAYALPVDELSESMTGELPVRWPGTDPAPADLV
jgi:ketosteroid isomerase-like protein